MMRHVKHHEHKGSSAPKSVLFFAIGICLFVVGIVLMAEMLVKFLKFVIGLILFIIGMQMIFGSIRFRWLRF